MTAPDGTLDGRITVTLTTDQVLALEHAANARMAVLARRPRPSTAALVEGEDINAACVALTDALEAEATMATPPDRRQPPTSPGRIPPTSPGGVSR